MKNCCLVGWTLFIFLVMLPYEERVFIVSLGTVMLISSRKEARSVGDEF